MVNILKQLDNAVNYIEANLCNEIDMDELCTNCLYNAR